MKVSELYECEEYEYVTYHRCPARDKKANNLKPLNPKQCFYSYIERIESIHHGSITA